VAELERILHRVPDRRGPASHRQLTIFVRRIVVLAGVVLALLALGAGGLAISEGDGLCTASAGHSTRQRPSVDFRSRARPPARSCRSP
jgi:hypothetical protein